MAAIFGVIGAITSNELDEMGRRLAHRGTRTYWKEVARDVYLGQVTKFEQGPLTQAEFSIVADAPEGLIPGSTARVVEAFVHTQRAEELDELLHMPFTLAAWDDANQRLMLVRDFLGLKPLHFCQLPSGGMAFATEYKALLAIGDVPARADLDSVRCLQMYKAMPSGRTLLADVTPVPPGSVVHFHRDGTIALHDRMPDVRLAVDPMTEEQACEQLRHKLEEAMHPLVAGRSRIGIALSGGIDSMSAAFLARRCAPDAELVGFTAGESPEDPEVRRASKVMASLNGRHEPLIVENSELMSRLPIAVWHLENPIGRSETFQYMSLARRARERGFDNLLTGMGADLLFGGMPRHKVLWMAEVMPLLRKDLLAFFESTQTGEPSRRPIARLMTSLYYRGGLPPAPAVVNCDRTYEPELLAEPGPEFINRCLMLDGQEPTSRTLARIERPLQAYGLDYGSPFLDKSVIQFAFTMPSHLKIRRGTQKYILRQAMKPYMSDELRRAPKELMRMQQGGEFARTLQQLADRYLSAERVKRRGFFEIEHLERIRRACRSRYHPKRPCDCGRRS